jgi:predicted transcriptional regulator
MEHTGSLIRGQVVAWAARVRAEKTATALGETMEASTLVTLTADIVCAHLSNTTVASADVPTLIQSIYGALAAADQPAAAAPEPLIPAVSVRSSVKPAAITCLECGARMKVLKRHLTTHHKLTPAEYKARWSLNADYLLVAPDYAATRKELAIKIGLGRKTNGRKRPAKAPAKATGNVRAIKTRAAKATARG